MGREEAGIGPAGRGRGLLSDAIASAGAGGCGGWAGAAEIPVRLIQKMRTQRISADFLRYFCDFSVKKSDRRRWGGVRGGGDRRRGGGRRGVAMAPRRRRRRRGEKGVVIYHERGKGRLGGR